MFRFPFVFESIPASTWALMSSILMIAIFFKFNRFWSFRNFDLLLLVLLVPGLLLVERGRNAGDTASPKQSNSNSSLAGLIKPVGSNLVGTATPGSRPEERKSTAAVVQESKVGEAELPPARTFDRGQILQRWGFIWLFSVGGLLLIRMLLDSALVRKPILDPNLTSSGLIFLGLSLMGFLFANILMTEPAAKDLNGARNALKFLQRQAADSTDVRQLEREGPGYWLFNLFPVISTFNSGDEILETDPDEAGQLARYVTAAKLLAIISQMLIVLGLIFFCYINYSSFSIGVGVATIYLMLPYTAMFTGYALHALPAALILGAIVWFRIPWLSGILIGFAVGVSYYPIFLIPLWCSFYWERGLRSFLIGLAASLAVCILGLVFTSPDISFFLEQLRAMFGFLLPRTEGLEGIWAIGWNSWYRLPLIVAHVALAISFAFWPIEKNIGALVSCTAAIMIAVQFWLGFDGGLTMAWYLPFVLLVFFRPNLNGRTAEVELNRKRRSQAEVASDLIV